MERSFFFKNRDYQLFGVLHTPEDAKVLLAEHKLGMLFCQPFAEEKMIAHRVVVNMARALASEGIACLRFDFMGEGDSEGDFEDSTIKTRLSDISAALSVLAEKAGVTKVGLIGVRFGATLAALAASQNEVDSLVLISPIVSGKLYMDQCLRSNLTTQLVVYKKVIKDRNQLINDLMKGGTVNIDGYLMNKYLYTETCEINLLNNIIPPVRNTLIIEIAKNEKQPEDMGLKKLYERYSKNQRTEFQRVQEELFWKDSKIYSPVAQALNEALRDWIMQSYNQ